VVDTPYPEVRDVAEDPQSLHLGEQGHTGACEPAFAGIFGGAVGEGCSSEVGEREDADAEIEEELDDALVRPQCTGSLERDDERDLPVGDGFVDVGSREADLDLAGVQPYLAFQRGELIQGRTKLCLWYLGLAVQRADLHIDAAVAQFRKPASA